MNDYVFNPAKITIIHYFFPMLLFSSHYINSKIRATFTL